MEYVRSVQWSLRVGVGRGKGDREGSPEKVDLTLEELVGIWLLRVGGSLKRR